MISRAEAARATPRSDIVSAERLAGSPRRTRGSTVVVVSHGAAIKTFVARGAPGLGTPGLRTYRAAHNTGVCVVERGPDGVHRLLVWNDASHLGDAVAEAVRG